MQTRVSPIFQEALKILAEKEKKDKDHIPFSVNDEITKKLDKSRRADSRSPEEIAAIINVRPESPEYAKYKNNIMEVAHPESQVLCPAYDKVNGLVENNIERQNIMLNIVLKHNDGLNTQHKYAQKELIMSLVRVGNDLDNQNKDQLRVLADTCLQQIALKKTAWILPAIGVAATLIGALYAQQHLPFFNDGVKKNGENLLSELTDLVNSNSWGGVGYDLSESLKGTAQDAINKVSQFLTTYDKIEPIILGIPKPKTAKELIENAKQPKAEVYTNAYNKLYANAINIIPYLNSLKNDFQNETYKKMQIKDTGLLTKVVDRLGLHGGYGLIGDDFDDVARAIPPFIKSVSDMLEMLKKAETIKETAAAQITEATNALGAHPTEETQKQTPNEENTSVSYDDLEKETNDLMGLT